MIQLNKWVSYNVLEIIYKLHFRAHLDSVDIVYHQTHLNNSRLSNQLTPPILKKIEKKMKKKWKQIKNIQYDAAKIITSSVDKLYRLWTTEWTNAMSKLTILYKTSLEAYPIST